VQCIKFDVVMLSMLSRLIYSADGFFLSLKDIFFWLYSNKIVDLDHPIIAFTKFTNLLNK